jgi:hypothetical protein
MGVLDKVFEAVAAEPDLEWVMLDAQALGRSRGGFGTKPHVSVDALGLPVRFIAEPGQQNERQLAPPAFRLPGFRERGLWDDDGQQRTGALSAGRRELLNR